MEFPELEYPTNFLYVWGGGGGEEGLSITHSDTLRSWVFPGFSRLIFLEYSGLKVEKLEVEGVSATYLKRKEGGGEEGGGGGAWLV